MAVKQIDYKINFTASDKQLNEVLNNLKSLTGKNGINLTDAMRGNLQKIEAMLPAYKEKLNKVLNSSQFNPFDVKALNNDIKTISNTIRNLFISISKQVLPKSISDQIDEITKIINSKTELSKKLGGEILARRNQLTTDDKGNVTLSGKNRNSLIAKSLGSVTIGDDVLLGYDQLVNKKTELEKSNKTETAEYKELTTVLEQANKLVRERVSLLQSEIVERQALRNSTITERDNARINLEELKNNTTSSDFLGLDDNQKEILKETSQGIIDLDKATSTYNSAVEKGAETQKQYQETAKKVDEVENKKTGTLTKAAKQVFTYGTALTLMRKLYREVITTVTEMDKSLTGMAVVTNMSREDTYKLVGELQNLADATGMATTEIADMATKYYQQGKSTQQVIQLTEAAAKAATIAGISGEESINLLTNAMNGFQMSASQALEVSDKFAALAAASATDYEELATALSKVAAQANLAGMSMDFTLGLIAKGIEVTREAPETIGTSLKTVIARMRELTDYGVTLEDGMDVNRVAKAFSNIGVEMMDEEGQFRNLEEVLTEVGQKWDTLTVNQKANVAVAAAGTRQQSRFIAMMQDFDRTLELVNISANSYGATLAQQAKYMEGIEAKTTLMKNALQEMIMEISNSKIIITIVESITWALDNWRTVSLALIPIATILLGLKIASIAATITQLGGIKALTVAKLLETKATWAAVAANLAWLASNPIGWILAGVAAIGALVAGIAIYVASLKTVEEATQDNIDAIAKLQIEIYELENTSTNLEQIADEFSNISSKIVKTSEDLSDLIELVQQFNDTAGVDIINPNADWETQRNQMYGYTSLQQQKIKNSYEKLDKQLAYNWTAKDELAIAERDKRWSGKAVTSGIFTSLGTAATGFFGGLGTGAALGSIVPGLGTLIGAAAGAITGGIIGLIGSGFAGDAVSKEIGKLTEEEKEAIIQKARDTLYNDKTQLEGLRQSVLYYTDSKEYSSQVQDIIGQISTTREAVNKYLKEDGFDYEGFLEDVNNINQDSQFKGMNFQTALETVLDSGKLSDYKDLLNNIDEDIGKLLSDSVGYFSGLGNVSDKAINNFDNLGYSLEQVNAVLSSANINAKALGMTTGEYIDRVYGQKDNFTNEDAYKAFIENEKITTEIKKKILSGDTAGLRDNELFKEYTEAEAKVEEFTKKLEPLQDKINKGEELSDEELANYQNWLSVIGQYQKIIDEVNDTEIDWATGSNILGIESVSDLTEEVTKLTSSMQRLNKINKLNDLTFEEQMQLLADYPELYEAMENGSLSLIEQEEFYNKEYNKILDNFKTNLNSLSLELTSKLNLRNNLSIPEILNLNEDSEEIKKWAAQTNQSVSKVWELVKQYQIDIESNQFAANKLEELGVQGLIDQSNLELIQSAKDRKNQLKILIEQENNALNLLSSDNKKYKDIQKSIIQNQAEIISESLASNSKLMEQFEKGMNKEYNNGTKISDYYKIINGNMIIDTEKLANIQDETFRKELEADLNNAVVNYNNFAEQIQDNNEDILDSYENLSTTITSMLEQEQEKLIESLEKRKDAYEDFFDELDKMQEEEDFEQDRDSLIKQISALSGANDSASKQRLKELQQELNELNEEELDRQTEEQRNAIIESIESQIEKEQETLDDISSGVGFISSLLADNNTDSIAEYLKKQGLDETSINSIIGQLLNGYNQLIPGYSTGGQVTHTGLAMVHGTITRPEAFLSADDNIMITNLLNILKSNLNGNRNLDVEDSNKILIENITIQTNQLNNNQDFRKAGNSLAEEFAKAIQKRGIPTNVKK